MKNTWRVLLVAMMLTVVGVPAVSAADASAIEVVTTETASAVTIALPSPRIADPVIDHEQSFVMNRDRGLVDRVGAAFVDNPTSERDLIGAASEKMTVAAVQTDLVERAEENTTKMLTSMLGVLGYDDVTVLFDGVSIDLCTVACAD